MKHVHGVACECGDATTATATIECPDCIACVCDACHERETRRPHVACDDDGAWHVILADGLRLAVDSARDGLMLIDRMAVSHA